LPKMEGQFPVVVLVHGSGPNDRDETIGGSRPFRDLAWGLAAQGVAVLRYDKRTKVHGPRIPADIGLDQEVVEDALSALGVARNRPEIDPKRVFLLGHSLGGILAPEIGRRDGELAGIVVLAAPARPFFEVLTSQLEYLASLESDPVSPARTQLDSLITLVSRVEAGEVPQDQAVLGAPPRYWREVAGIDPVAVAKALSTPIFVLQGGRDYQSTAEDLRLWDEGLGGKEGFSSKLYPDLNHLFAPGRGTATPEEYVSGAGHVADQVILDLVRWIQEIGGGVTPLVGTALASLWVVRQVVPAMVERALDEKRTTMSPVWGRNEREREMGSRHGRARGISPPFFLRDPNPKATAGELRPDLRIGRRV
ncbi:MAG: alpha/beta hydrolase, partial [Longimicrobiales bacterium]|nr:alpha/beta hydrolase [Longimicrobiales bacterium]